jgi:FKBP-type peptidyl-prolyl cis-trans isomerase
MKRSYLPLSLLVAGVYQTSFAETTLKDDKQKQSYSIGQQIGRSFKEQGLDLDLGILSSSIKDVLDGKPSLLKPEEMQQVMMELQQSMQKKREEMGKVNLEKGKVFLEENKKKAGVKTTPSGLQYEVMTEGKGDKPLDTSTVEVHYKGTLIDGSEFDSSYKRNEPARFPVNGVIKGWTEALKMMQPGAKWKLVIPSQLAYEATDRPGIPANSVLVFEVELLKIIPEKK